MTARELAILDRLGIDINKSRDDILTDLINLSEFLFDSLELEEEERFAKEIKRIQKPTN